MSNNAKKLIVYFTSSGTTKRAAQQIKKYIDADLIELHSVVPYPADYQEVAERGQNEMDNNIHPELDTSNLPDFRNYDVIFVGFPTWWGQPPMIIHSLFETEDFDNKVIVPFTTSMSSTIDESMPYFKEMVSNFKEAKLVDGIKYDNDGNLKEFLQKNSLV